LAPPMRIATPDLRNRGTDPPSAIMGFAERLVASRE